jgi:hypothetical protein
MGFMADDEYVLLMETPDPRRHFTVNDMKMCADVGVRTTLRIQHWQTVNPEKNVWDWSNLESHLENARIAGLKTLVMAPGHVPLWFPDDWYVHAAYPREEPGINIRRNPDPDWSIFSPWHAEAREAVDEYLHLFCDRYSSDTVRVVCAPSGCGESFLPPGHRGFFDPAAKRAFKERFGHPFMIGQHQDRWSTRMMHQMDPDTRELSQWIQDTALERMIHDQKILMLYQPDADLWVLSHGLFEYWRGMWDSGNCLDRMYPAMWDLGAENVYGLNFTHYPHGSQWMAIVVPQIHRHRVQMWTGSEYCEGLRVNLQAGIKTGMRGMLTCPNHQFIPHERVEPWMAEEFRKTIAAFRRRDGHA